MPIFAGSRYEGLSFTPLIDDDGEITRRFIHLRVPPPPRSARQHELLPGEEIDFLAYHYLGQARRWWQIAEVNNLFWPLDLPQASRVDVPT
jgi:hypothetical protein